LTDGLDNIRVCSATADISAHSLAYLFCRQFVPSRRVQYVRRDVARHAFRSFREHRYSRHDLSRRAITALKGVALDKSGLHRVKFVAVQKTFDGSNLVPLVCDCEGQTRECPAPIDMYGARPALTVIARLLGSG
jgi:hypothetical protein